jgi:hypothetical protein
MTNTTTTPHIADPHDSSEPLVLASSLETARTLP